MLKYVLVMIENEIIPVLSDKLKLVPITARNVIGLFL